MQKNVTWKKLLLFACSCLIVLSGCRAQLEKGLNDMFHTASSQVVLQIPTEHTERTSMLNEGEWLANDDAASQVSLHDKKIFPACREVLHPLLLLHALLAGLAALFAYAAACVYHKSSCPTRGLSRILAFILNTDGQKDNIFFLFEG